jgi:uncharacterized membrane-anchored protein YhcB (DUF1043 family)
MTVAILAMRGVCVFVIIGVLVHVFTLAHINDIHQKYQDELNKCEKQYDRYGSLSHYKCGVSIKHLRLSTAVRG